MDRVDELLQRFGAHDVDRALCLLCESHAWVRTDKTVPLPINRILAEAWKPIRLERCRELLREGKRPPPVNATGMRFKLGSRRVTLWSLSDGNHRTIAAKEAGETHVQSKVAGHYAVDPSRCRIMDGKLWSPMERPGWMNLVADLDEKQAAILRYFGVL